MEFLSVSIATLVFALVMCVFERPRRTLGAKERRLRAIEESETVSFGELEGSILARVFGPAFEKLKRKLAIKRAKAANGSGKLSSRMAKRERQLRSAGIYMGANAFVAVKAVAMAALAGTALLLTMNAALDGAIKLLVPLVAGLAAFILPDFLIKFLANSRQASMRKQLPDLMDLLSVSIDAGLGFDAALKRALDKFTGALKEELTVASMEIAMGKPRRDALSDMAERCGIQELRIMVAAIVQSEQMGTPIKNVLKTQSAQLRANRKQAAQEKGMKAPVKMMLPMVAFVFPVLLIVLMAPTVANLKDLF